MRDEQAKRERGYVDKSTIVRPDGSEILVGKDWAKRKLAVWERGKGRCERLLSDGLRCRNEMHDPHHMKPRSKGRDDRIDNLIGLCRPCHQLLDWKRLKWTDLRRAVPLNKCSKHPRAVYFDGKECTACEAEREMKELYG